MHTLWALLNALYEVVSNVEVVSVNRTKKKLNLTIAPVCTVSCSRVFLAAVPTFQLGSTVILWGSRCSADFPVSEGAAHFFSLTASVILAFGA